MTTPALPHESVQKAISDFQSGQLSALELAERILSTENQISSHGVRIDIDRQRRCGFPEVIYAEGKTVDAVIAAIDRILKSFVGAEPGEVLVTRISVDHARYVGEHFSCVRWDARGRIMRISNRQSILSPDEVSSSPLEIVNVVCAGTADLPVALETRETLAWMGIGSRLIEDVGVAGLYRLLGQLESLRSAAVNIVVAGMEGALPSVIGGLVQTPVIAVPTSVGYGANFQGLTALLSMINSCSANICVVNIDAGFKAGYLAGLIARPILKAL